MIIERRDLSPKGQAIRRVMEHAKNLDEPMNLSQVVRLLAEMYEEGRAAGVSEALTAANEAWHKIDTILTGREEALHSERRTGSRSLKED